MRFRDMIIWLKRATGFGYKSYPPLNEMIDHERAADMESKSRNLREEVDYIETLLERRNYVNNHRR